MNNVNVSYASTEKAQVVEFIQNRLENHYDFANQIFDDREEMGEEFDLEWSVGNFINYNIDIDNFEGYDSEVEEAVSEFVWAMGEDDIVWGRKVEDYNTNEELQEYVDFCIENGIDYLNSDVKSVC